MMRNQSTEVEDMDNTYDGGTFEFYYFHRDLLAQSERAISMMQMLTRAATSFFNQIQSRS